MGATDPSEADAIAERYARRHVGDRYSNLRPDVFQPVQERLGGIVGLLRRHAPKPIEELDVIEIGCGSGGNLLELVRLGFDPARLVGNELLADRAEYARSRLPAATELVEGDATRLGFGAGSFDVVYQSTVFTSLLDRGFQQDLAARMWNWVRPGGAVLWYDFVYDNPANEDVAGIPRKRVQELFPHGVIDARRVTLAPPISRRVASRHPAMYTLFNAVPLLRTHLLCWIAKPRVS